MQSAHLKKDDTNVTDDTFFDYRSSMTSPVLVNIGVRLHVAVEHGLVDARVVALGALEGLRAEVVTRVVLQVVLVLSHERTLGTLQHFVVLDMQTRVLPILLLK